MFTYIKKSLLPLTTYFMHTCMEGQKIMHNMCKLLKGFHVVQARHDVIKTYVLPLNLPQPHQICFLREKKINHMCSSNLF